MSRPEDTIEPDHVTQTALRRLPIPAHGETFWDDLARSLAAEVPALGSAAAPADRTDRLTVPGRPAAEPVVDDSLALLPLALRRRSNAVVVAVAAAAVVMVMFAGASLVSGGSDDDPVDLANAGPAEQPGTPSARPTSAPPITLSTRHEEESSAAVVAWVDAVHAGDADAAWQAMGPRSQDHFGSEAAFAEELAAMDDRFGGWSEADADDVLITPVLANADGTVAVVTFVGTTQIDGDTQRRAAAFPVRIVDGEVVLEPFADAGELEIVVPGAVEAVGALAIVDDGDELVAVVPEGVEAPILRLDDGDAVVCGQGEDSELRPMDNLPTQRCSYLPKAGITVGEHALTVAFVGADGAAISAKAVLFQAA